MPDTSQSILALRDMPDFSEQCVVLDDGTEDRDTRFAGLRPLSAWWQAAEEKPPPRSALDPFSFGGTLVGYLIMLDVINEGADFRWRLFGGRHAQEFGADLTNVSISDLIENHPAAIDLMRVMQDVVERKSLVPFEIRYFSENRLLRQAVGLFMPLTGEAGETGEVKYLFGAADWVKAR